MITITDGEGRVIWITIEDGGVEFQMSNRYAYISREDARQLRRFLEALG